jgi:hypothetical protein
VGVRAHVRMCLCVRAHVRVCSLQVSWCVCVCVWIERERRASKSV